MGSTVLYVRRAFRTVSRSTRDAAARPRGVNEGERRAATLPYRASVALEFNY